MLIPPPKTRSTSRWPATKRHLVASLLLSLCAPVFEFNQASDLTPFMLFTPLLKMRVII